MAQQLEKRQAPGRNGFKYKQRYGIIVICTDEGHQQKVYSTLKRAGYNLKVVAV